MVCLLLGLPGAGEGLAAGDLGLGPLFSGTVPTRRSEVALVKVAP